VPLRGQPTFSRARHDAILAILRNLRAVDGQEDEHGTRETLELLDPRWTAERWAEVRDRLAPGKSPRDGGLSESTAQLVAVFGPVLLTEESRQRAKARLAEAEERRRRRPEAMAELRERFGWPNLSAAEEAALDAQHEALIADLERRAGLRNEQIRIDAETHRKLMSLAILARATLSEALADPWSTMPTSSTNRQVAAERGVGVEDVLAEWVAAGGR
jgi:hypothetical protein